MSLGGVFGSVMTVSVEPAGEAPLGCPVGVSTGSWRLPAKSALADPLANDFIRAKRSYLVKEEPFKGSSVL